MNEEEKKIEEKIQPWRFRFFLAVSALLIITFVYYLPVRFLYNSMGGHMDAGQMTTMGNDHTMSSSGLLSADQIAKLPLTTRGGDIPELPYTLGKDGIKEFRLVAEEFRWEYQPGKFVHVWGYNGSIPGPTIRATEGETVRIIVKNNLSVDTSVHWHGVDVPWQQDGVPYITQAPIKPSAEYIYEFKALPAGTRFYHSHGANHLTAAQQMDMGLAGAFIIEPKNKADFPAFDKDFVVVLDEWDIQAGGVNPAIAHVHGPAIDGAIPEFNTFTINGKAFPGTDPINVEKNEQVLIRFINAGTAAIHPMHLHGHNFTVVAKDGNLIPKNAREVRNTISIGPGETVDILVATNNPGPWMLHCHHVHHASAGMMMLFKYAGYEPLMSEPSIPEMDMNMMMESMPHTH